jgi:NAD(P)-dependent dehydrogenase (short-subunit alcohol dehydrogenase family)
MDTATGFVLVTGGSRGIGAATARLAAEHGYDVCVAYRDRADLAQAVVNDIEAMGMRALAVRADVSQEQDVVRLFATAQTELGRLVGLVTNAGVLDRQSRVADLEAGRIQRILAVNVLGAFLCAREAVRAMSTADGGVGGAIVNVSSRAAVLGGSGEYVD